MEDKRQILRNKSQYVKKVKKWNMLDELQHQWVLMKVRVQKFSRFGKLRYKVEQKLKQNDELEGMFGAHDGKRNYLWVKP